MLGKGPDAPLKKVGEPRPDFRAMAGFTERSQQWSTGGPGSTCGPKPSLSPIPNMFFS